MEEKLRERAKASKFPLRKKRRAIASFFLVFFLSLFFFSFDIEKAESKINIQEKKTALSLHTSSPSQASENPLEPPKKDFSGDSMVFRKLISRIESALFPIKILPVQSGGRIKPFDSFAKESLQLIYGRKNFNGQEASQVIFTWMLLPTVWEEGELIEIKNHSLKKDLGLPEKTKHFSPLEIKKNEKVSLLVQELNQKREKEEKLNIYFEAVQRLENQMNLFYALAYQQALPVAPSKERSRWESVGELQGELKEKFQNVLASFMKTVSVFLPSSSSFGEKRREAHNEAEQKRAKENFKKVLLNFIQAAKAKAPDQYAQMRKIKTEVHYNSLKPFLWSWIIYFIGFFFFLFHVFSNSDSSKEGIFSASKRLVSFYKLGWGCLVLAFFLHTYGMALRVYITGRPPVTNMYETLLWVPWGSVLFAMILEGIWKQVYPLIAASLVSVLCLVLSDLAPSVLDGSLQPLQPVLRDNFWLVVHVMTICLSYAAFFLALFQADILLLFYILNEKKYKIQITKGVQIIYRSLQVGVLLLGMGTVLGGLWADLSWGRFWGWDPKETWALITLLGYLALLHGRLSGWIKEFGTVVGSIVAFSLVIMAWYGVNFVLGQGLHSYGFGTGGRGFIFSFASLHFLFVLYAYFLRRKRKQLT